MSKFKSSCLESIDFLGTPITYTIKGRNKYYKPFGGCLSIFVCLGLLALISVFVIPFVQRLDPRVVYQNVKKENPTLWELKKNNFYLGMKLDFTGYSTFELMSIFDFEFQFVTQYQHTNKSTTFEKSPLEIAPQSKEDFANNTFLFESQGLADSFRLNFDDQMGLSGTGISEIFSYCQLKIKLKNNTDEYLFSVFDFLNANPGYIKIFYPDASIQLKNYLEPVQTYISFFTDDIPNMTKKKTTVEFSVNNITTDLGYAFETNYRTDLNIMHFSTSTVSSTRSNNDLDVYEVVLCMSKYEPVYARSYMKLPELLASVGGLINIVLILFRRLDEFVSDYLLNATLMQTIFEFDMKSLEVGRNKNQKSLSQNDKKLAPKLARQMSLMDASKFYKKVFNDENNKSKDDKKGEVLELSFMSNNNKKNDLTILENQEFAENKSQYSSVINSSKIDSSRMLFHQKPKQKLLPKRRDFGSQETSSKIEKSEINSTPDLSILNLNVKNKNDLGQVQQPELKNINYTSNNEKNLNEKKSDKDLGPSKNNIKKPKTPFTFFTSCEAFLLSFCCCFKTSYTKRKIEIYKKTYSLMQHYVDFTKVVKKSMEIDLLKYLVLNRDQIALYNLIKKPVMSLHERPEETTASYRFADVFTLYSECSPLSIEEIKNMSIEQKDDLKSTITRVESKKNKLSVIDKKVLHCLGNSNELLKEE
jgi:hypothetical protein